MIQVVNKHIHKPTRNDFYIGRGSVLGNPYSHLPGTLATVVVESREEAIEKYEHWIDQQMSNKNKDVIGALNAIATIVMQTGHVNLVCYCAPKSCHGDVIKEIVMQKLNNL